MAAAAFPAFHVTGAIHHYVTYPGQATALYLGTCETSPQVAFQELYKDVHNDVTGPSLPAQRIENGEMATMAIGLNRFSKATWYSMLAATAPSRRGRFSRGLTTFGSGGLAQGAGTTAQLWMVFENFLDASVRALFPSMEQGWYWPMVQIQGKEFPRMGNGNDTLLVIRAEAHPIHTVQADVAAAVGATERQWLLYSTTAGDFPAGTLIPQ